MSKKVKLFLASLLLMVAVCSTVVGCQFKAIYLVNFNTNGGTAVASVEVESGATIQKPEDPTKVGYEFAGWYLNGVEFSFDQAIKEEITLDAKWAPSENTAYTVKHFKEKLDGSGYEEVAEDAETLHGRTDADTNAVAKSYVGFTALAINQQKIAPDGSTVVEVKYDRALIKITWVIDGVSTQESFKYGCMPSHADPVKAADNVYTYTFSGWDSELVAVEEEKTYTATFEKTFINYTVVFKNENGEVISSKEDYHYGDTIVVPEEIPTKDADKVYTYTFSGWNNAETVTGNVEYVASFTPVYINYTVEFVGVNGEVFSSKTDYHYGDAVVVPAHSESHPGFNYGWDREFTAVEQSTVYYETRDPKTFGVEFDANGGELEGELTSYVFGVGVSLPEASKIGHTFKGWYEDSSFAGEAVSAITNEDVGNKKYFAKWEANTYNVTLVPGLGNVESELTSYVYGVGASLPNSIRKGYTLAGWYENAEFDGEPVSEITATDLGDKAFYAKYTPNKDTKYSVQVLVAQYSQKSSGGYYFAGDVAYVDATADFADVLGLDENNKGQGETDSTVDLTALIATIKGAKLNAESVVSGVIDADETLALSVKLDFDEQALGFKLENLKLGQYSCDNLTFTLKYYDGICGLAIDGTIGNGKEILINVDEVVVPKYATVSFNYYEKSASLTSKITALSEILEFNKATNHVEFVKASNPADYIHAPVNLMTQFPDVKVIKQINIKLLGGGEKHVFIGGLEKVNFVKESVTYNVENGNLMGIAKPLNGGTLSQVENYHFSNGTAGEEVDLHSSALVYTYTSDTAISANHTAGVKFNLGGIRVSDYKSIKILARAARVDGNGANLGFIYCNGIEIASKYGGAFIIDVKALCEAKGVTMFSELEIALQGWAGGDSYVLYVGFIELEVDENAPIVDDNAYYSVTLNANGGELASQLTSYAYGVGASLPTASKAGYTFKGWYTNADFAGEAVTEISASDLGNKAFYAKWEANSYNVSLNANGGEVEGELTSYVYGVGASLPAVTKVGHTFKGWYANADFAGEAVTEISASDLGDKAFYAKWEANVYNVTLVVNGGVLESELTSYVYGVGATLPVVSKVGDTFGGWFTNSGFGGEAVTEISATDLGDKTFYAKWEANTYNVTLVTNGGQLEEDLASYIYGIGATLPAISKAGHTFKGWYENADFNGEAVTEIGTTDLGDKTFYAKFEVNTYSVTLVANGGALEGELTSYVYGVGASLPTASKLGYTLEGWYANAEFSGEAVSAISASDLGDKTYYAKFTANEDTPYSFKVLVAQYAQSYADKMYFAGALSYVDATAEYAHLFGIDAEKLYGTTDSVIDLTSAVAGLKGAKVNAESVLSGTIAADGSLALVIKLDFDEQALGFNLSDLKIGEYSCDNLTFTLKNHDGVWGLAIDGTIGNGKEIRIQTNYVVADYVKVALTYYEKSPHTSSQVAVISNGAASSYITLTSATEPSDYVKAQTELISKFSTVATIDEIRLKILAPAGKSTEKHIFIAGIEAIQYTRETVTYSIANGNLMGIATGTKDGAVSELANASYISGYAKVLHYTYEGTIPAINEVGLVFDLGNLKVSEYESIKVAFRSYKNASGNGTGVKAFINGTVGLTDVFYGGVKVFDAKALAEANNVSVISSIELLYPWTSAESIVYEICVASIELVLKPSCPGCGVIGETHEKCEYCEGYLCVGEHGDCAPVILCPGCNSTEVAHGICEYCEKYLCVGDHNSCGDPQSVTYSVENGNLEEMVQPVSKGEVSTEVASEWANTAIGSVTAVKYVGDSTEGLTFDLGKTITVADYKTIKIDLNSLNGNGVNIYLDGINVTGGWSNGAKTLSILQLISEYSGTIESFRTIQIVGKQSYDASFELLVAQIVFEAK